MMGFCWAWLRAVVLLAWLCAGPCCSGVPLGAAVAPCRLGGQDVEAVGGPLPWVKSWVHAVSQGQPVGRCMVIRRAEVAIRAGTAMSLRRMVAVVVLARSGPAMAAAARVRLKAITARTSQTSHGVNCQGSRCS